MIFFAIFYLSLFKWAYRQDDSLSIPTKQQNWQEIKHLFPPLNNVFNEI